MQRKSSVIFLFYIALDSQVPPLKVSPLHRVRQELSEGGSGNISCQIEGKVTSYTWVLPNGKQLPSRMRAVRNVLTISLVLREDAGIYTCEAVGGSDNSQVVEALVNLTVQRKYSFGNQ